MRAIQALRMRSPASGTGDPNFASVVLLIGADGADASTAFIDQSPVARTLSLTGDTQFDTAQSKFGGSSALWDGVGDRLIAADSNDFNLAAGNFTAEMFIRPSAVSGVQMLIGQWENAPNLGWVMYLNGAALAFNISTTGSDNNVQVSGGTVSSGAWSHVCVDFDGTKYRAYLNGTMVASSTTLRTIFNSNLTLTMGASASTATLAYAGWMDEIRLTKGVARYASDSGFTVPSAAFPRS